ncbi:hypothetical protein [Priestia aryabhattai]|uniref:hypothetical protein n=1 Tax=Priestia aryabhattai TaxID=412384 RepID=UPI001CC9CC40|nr:hypothetical protein [Priestia aryabhattai]MBZ6484009.1 hypothetical protein [Priestia aryabhattai]
MGSDRFSSGKKKRNVDILKQLLNNLDTSPTQNPSSSETLLSGLDLSSLEDLMRQNRKSHDMFDHKKKKRHHDDFDHKKKHDHDDFDHKKKHHHDDCHDKKKHDHDDCHDKKKCCHDDGGDKKMFHKDDWDFHKNPCKKCFKHDCDCEICKCPCDAAAAVCSIVGRIFWELKATADVEMDVELPVPPAPEAPEAPEVNKEKVIWLLKKLSKILDKDCKIKSSLLDDLDDLTWWLVASEEVQSVLIWKIKKFLKDLLKCLGLKKEHCIHDLFSFPPVTPPEGPEEPEEPGTGTGTISEQLLGAMLQVVTITTPTGVYTGTLVTVQTDYIAIIEPTGTRLIAIDTIQTFSIE